MQPEPARDDDEAKERERVERERRAGRVLSNLEHGLDWSQPASAALAAEFLAASCSCMQQLFRF